MQNSLFSMIALDYRDNCKGFSSGELDAVTLAQIHSQFQGKNSKPSLTKSVVHTVDIPVDAIKYMNDIMQALFKCIPAGFSRKLYFIN